MSKSVFARVCVGAVIFATVVSAQLTAALTHEAHKMTCDETAMNAMNADIQALPDGDAKTKATNELAMAEEMMGKNDMKGCEAHMHNAMEAMEE
ncbi:MAG TPA: hypothetical protein VLE25_10725 [Nitrospira sp.]|nr:hypothetical protein [Nitrospira sp.]